MTFCRPGWLAPFLSSWLISSLGGGCAVIGTIAAYVTVLSSTSPSCPRPALTTSPRDAAPPVALFVDFLYSSQLHFAGTRTTRTVATCKINMIRMFYTWLHVLRTTFCWTGRISHRRSVAAKYFCRHVHVTKYRLLLHVKLIQQMLKTHDNTTVRTEHEDA